MITTFEEAISWSHRNAADYGSAHSALIDLLFSPAESYDDPWLNVIWDAAKYIESQPCRCVNTDPDAWGPLIPAAAPWDDGDQCSRCEVLHRYFNEPLGR